LKYTSIIDTVARTDCKCIGLHLVWDKNQSGMGGIWVTYLKINFRLGLSRVKF
jgi:hypothetical protein